MSNESSDTARESEVGAASHVSGKFQIPLNSIERFHLFDDEPDYPNVVFGKLKFDVPLDLEVAKQAWQIALTPHPFANVKPIAKSSFWGEQWSWSGVRVDQQDVFDWAYSKVEPLSASEADRWSVKRHGCQSKTGCYLGIYPGAANEHSQAIFCIHHAVADGIACLKVINDWLIVYNNLRSGRDPVQGVSSTKFDLIHDRARLGLSSWRYLRHLPFQAIAIFGAAKFIFRKTQPAIPANAKKSASRPSVEDAADHVPFPAIASRWIETELAAELDSQSGKLSVTSTSYLLGCWFETLGKVREFQFKQSADKDWLRVILPMSIRGYEDRRLPAANRTAIVQIDRQPPGTDFANFVRMLHREIGIIRRFELEKMFLILIRAFGISNRLLRRMASNKNSRGAAVFTDLHRPFATSEKRIARLAKSTHSTPADCRESCLHPVDFELAGPIRNGTPLNLSFARFNRRIKLSLHYDSRQVSNSEANSILEWFVESIKSRLGVEKQE